MIERFNKADTVGATLNRALLILCKFNEQMDRGRNGTRYFRNPPQPHMCIQDYIEGYDQTCFINVLSWAKISTPRQPEDPIPLYGGMRVPHNSTSCVMVSSHKMTKRQPIIFAVMANPEILRLSGKTAEDPSNRDALVELMLDFVEAMNPEVKFKRQFTVVRDRDLAGELKDIWLAVQVKRERERGENGRRSEVDHSRESKEDSSSSGEEHDGPADETRDRDRGIKHVRLKKNEMESPMNSCDTERRDIHRRESSSTVMVLDDRLATLSTESMNSNDTQHQIAMRKHDESLFVLIDRNEGGSLQSNPTDEAIIPINPSEQNFLTIYSTTHTGISSNESKDQVIHPFLNKYLEDQSTCVLDVASNPQSEEGSTARNLLVQLDHDYVMDHNFHVLGAYKGNNIDYKQHDVPTSVVTFSESRLSCVENIGNDSKNKENFTEGDILSKHSFHVIKSNLKNTNMNATSMESGSIEDRNIVSNSVKEPNSEAEALSPTNRSHEELLLLQAPVISESSRTELASATGKSSVVIP